MLSEYHDTIEINEMIEAQKADPLIMKQKANTAWGDG